MNGYPAARDARQGFGHLEYVTGIDVGYKYVNGKMTHELSIRFHVQSKKPLAELDDSEVFPSQIRKLPTDVLEASYTTHSATRQSANDPVLPGISVSRADGTFGTIGAIVFDTQTGEKHILSNWHTLAGATTPPGHPIVQPGTFDGGQHPQHTIGVLARTLLDSDGDAAIARLNDQRTVSRSQFQSGVTLTETGPANVGDILEKSGRSTGVTQAVVDGIGEYSFTHPIGEVRIDGFRLVPLEGDNLSNLEISKSGDSGAVWYIPASSVGVGLHIGGETNPAPENEHAIACLLGTVISRLNVTLNPDDIVSSGIGPSTSLVEADVFTPNFSNKEQIMLELPNNFEELIEKGYITGDVLTSIEASSVEGANMADIFIDPIELPETISEGAEYTHKLGTHNLPKNTRLHKHSMFDYRFETRSVKWEVFITFKHPTMSDFVNDAITCVGAAALGSVVAAVVFQSPSVGLAIFKPAWKACMVVKIGSRANEISIELGKHKIHGPWEGH